MQGIPFSIVVPKPSLEIPVLPERFAFIGGPVLRPHLSVYFR
jgi:hypothetical protein